MASSTPSSQTQPTWRVQIPHPLEGQIKCNCKEGSNLAVLFMSHTKANPDRQFFKCRNSSKDNDIGCRYFKWADELSGPGVPSSEPSPSQGSSQGSPQASQSTQPTSPQAAPPSVASRFPSTAPAPAASPVGLGGTPATPHRNVPTTPRPPRTKEERDSRLARLAGILNEGNSGVAVKEERRSPSRDRITDPRQGSKASVSHDQSREAYVSPPSTQPHAQPQPSQSQKSSATLADSDEDLYDDDVYKDMEWPPIAGGPARQSEPGPSTSADGPPNRSSMDAGAGAGTRRSFDSMRSAESSLPTPHGTPSDNAGRNSYDGDRPSPSKKRREEIDEMEDAQHNPFLDRGRSISTTLSVTSNSQGRSRITVLEERVNEYGQSIQDLQQQIHEQARVVEEQSARIDHLTQVANNATRQLSHLQREVKAHHDSLFTADDNA